MGFRAVRAVLSGSVRLSSRALHQISAGLKVHVGKVVEFLSEPEKKTENKFPYINRELSWMDFNARVLEEAFNRRNPIMERMNFLGITESNLDEFFMVRVAGVQEQVESNYLVSDPSGL
ncbi:MAG TPA: hypothetical protein DDW99_00745, partial [Ruminococcaceae bacterium]|nr:hypothetical protein [Oscillospiraceae bacterium]